ncbi:MAG: YhjD/YihY/BrkB family envelope integrity protein, partial [Limosilactobacillus fermentum]
MKFIGTKLKRFVTAFAEHFQMAQVTTSAAVLAYYTLLSIFPAVLVVGNLLPMLGLDAKTVLPYLQSAIPSSVYQFIRPIIFDFLRRGSGGILTTGALVALWSTSQGIAAFQRSVNGAYGVAKNQNPIINRVLSFIWMIIVIM